MNSTKSCQNEKNNRHADYISAFIIQNANVYVFSENT